MTTTSNVGAATQIFQEHEKSRFMTPQENCSSLPVIESKDREICDLADKEFKVAALWKLNEPQAERQVNEISKAIHK